MSYFEEISIRYDGTSRDQVDAFGRLRVGQPRILFDSKFVHGKIAILWDEVTGGTASSVHDDEETAIIMRTYTDGDYAIRQTNERFNYQPARSQAILIGSIIEPQVNITKRIGYFDTASDAPYEKRLDGVWFESDGDGVYCCYGNKFTGITRINQDDWNIDKMDGTGVSGLDLEWDKIQSFLIDYEWPGVIRYGFNGNGKTYYCHIVAQNNTLQTVAVHSPNHPLRMEIRQKEPPLSSSSSSTSSSSSQSDSSTSSQSSSSQSSHSSSSSSVSSSSSTSQSSSSKSSRSSSSQSETSSSSVSSASSVSGSSTSSLSSSSNSSSSSSLSSSSSESSQSSTSRSSFSSGYDGNGVLKVFGCAVASEGGNDPVGVIISEGTSGAQVTCTSEDTLYAVIGLRLQQDHLDDVVNILTAAMLVITATSDIEWQIRYNPTVAGTFNYSDVTGSICQTALGSSSNTVTGGFVLDRGFASAGGGTSAAGVDTETVYNAVRLGAKIDGTLDTMILCAKPIAGSSGVDVEGILTWREDQ